VQIQQHHSLAGLTTFGLPATAEHFVSCTSLEEVREALDWHRNHGGELHVLGGGSNVLLASDLGGLVLHMGILGVEELSRADGQVLVKVGAGVVWHDFVMTALDRGWYGLENLSLIPGSTGAGPMQNIGAYGVELEEYFHALEAVEVKTGAVQQFSHGECAFGYRESVFKRALKGQFAITSVTFRLSEAPELRLGYGAIRSELEAAGVEEPTARSVSDAVIRIRRSKLPDPAVLGNAGSFFKNPVVGDDVSKALKAQFPEMPQYPTPGGVKLAAGWLIDQAGWKGHDRGTCGVHDRQALVLVNKGGATGQDILQLAKEVQQDVVDRFGVALEREVNVLPEVVAGG
jgi:UDP-N-acetylmuramate dehydrogenase